MPHYLITYDLRKQRNYQPLYDALTHWKAAKLLESVWLVELVGPAVEIRNILQTWIDGDDGVAVIELKPGIQWGTVNCHDAGTRLLKAISP